MSDLANKKCIPCEGGIPPFDVSEIHKYLKKVDGWDVKKNKDESFFIEKEFKFKNFLESQKFINEVGKIAENEGHHPEITFGWGYAKVNITTHAIEGLSEKFLNLNSFSIKKLSSLFFFTSHPSTFFRYL